MRSGKTETKCRLCEPTLNLSWNSNRAIETMHVVYIRNVYEVQFQFIV